MIMPTADMNSAIMMSASGILLSIISKLLTCAAHRVNAFRMNEHKKIARLLRLARGKLGISQAQFAKHFNVNQSTLCRWEHNKINIDPRTEFWIQHVLGKLAYDYAKQNRP